MPRVTGEGTQATRRQRRTTDPTQAQVAAARKALKALEPESRQALMDLFDKIERIGKEGDKAQEGEAIDAIVRSARQALGYIVVSTSEKLSSLLNAIPVYDRYNSFSSKTNAREGTGTLTFKATDRGGCSQWRLTYVFSATPDQVKVEFKAAEDRLPAYPSGIVFNRDERGALAVFLREKILEQDASLPRAQRFLKLLEG